MWEAKILWPQETFSEIKFKTGSYDLKAGMAVHIIQSKILIGLNANKIIDLLGEETGDYYNSDSNFTYKLTDKGNADWILTLVVKEDGTIDDVFIRKSCCSISQKILHWSIKILNPLFKKVTMWLIPKMRVN